MTRSLPEPDPDEPEIPDAPGDVPPGTAPEAPAEPGTSETLPPAQGVRRPSPDDPA